MGSEPTNKRIKLSLEPFIDNKTLDITNAGHEILKPEVSLAEKMMQTVDRVWFERGEWKDITEESLQESSTSAENKQLEKDDQVENQEQQLQAVPPGVDAVKLRESVVNKLLHAKSEIDVALDVINILAASHHASTAKDLVLPAGSLSATYVTKPKSTMKAELEAVQLNLGLKRKQQKQASDYLKNSANGLKAIIEKERGFWDEALNLRRHNWIMYANTTQPNNSFLIQYGFAEVGSDFNEASLGELKRVDDSVNLSVAHDQPWRVTVHTRHVDSVLVKDEEKENSYYEPKVKDIQGQLVQANSTVFDAELFSHILSEAQTLNSNVRIGNDKIEINIDGDMDLSISKLLVTSKIENEKPAKQICMVDLALRLLLLQRHDFNMWKNKARILSSNYAIQQSLAKKNEIPTNQNAIVSRSRNTIDLPKTVPVLSPVLSISRFWVQFDRIRQVVHSVLHPFRRLGFTVHFKISTDDNNNKHLYPGYGTMTLYFNIGLRKGSHLQFALNQQSGAITVILPQATVTLQHVSELRVFLSREMNIMCLGSICDVANDIIRVHPDYSAKKMVLWKLDRINEVIHSSLCTADDQWKHIDAQLHHDATMQSFSIQITVSGERIYRLQNTQEHSALTFKEKVAALIKQVMNEQ